MFGSQWESQLLGLLFAFLALPPLHAEPVRTLTLAVENMTCGMGPITIRKALEGVEWVREAQASLETETATVTFDPD